MLIEELAALKRSQAAEQAAMQRLRDDLDPTLGERTRVFTTMLTGVLWTLAPLLALLGPPITLPGLAGFNLLMLAGLLGMMVWAWDSMSRTAINRRVVLATLLVPLGTLMFCGWGMFTGAAPEDVITLSIALYCVLSAMLAISVEVLLAPMAIFYLMAFFAATIWPSILYFAVAAANLGMTITLGIVSLVRHRQHAARAARRPPRTPGA
mgnify:FL=1